MNAAEDRAYLAQVAAELAPNGPVLTEHYGEPVLDFPAFADEPNGFTVTAETEGGSRSLNIVPNHARCFPEVPRGDAVAAAGVVRAYIERNLA